MRACVYVGAHTHAGARGHSISNPAVLKRYLIPTQVSPSLLVLATKGHCILAPYTICLNLNYITLHIAWHRKGCQLATQSVPKQVASVCTLLPKHPPFFRTCSVLTACSLSGRLHFCSPLLQIFHFCKVAVIYSFLKVSSFPLISRHVGKE